MSHDHSPVLTQMPDDRSDISRQQAHVVVFIACRFVAEVITPLVNRNHLKIVAQAFHLMSPAVPEVREAVNHDNQRALSCRGVVDFCAVIVGISMFSIGPDVRMCQSGSHQEQQQDCRFKTVIQYSAHCACLPCLIMCSNGNIVA